MGFLSLLLFFIVVYFGFRWIWKVVTSILTPPRQQAYNRQQKTQQEPETQEERILDFQKKSFESADAEDVDFEEIKE